MRSSSRVLFASLCAALLLPAVPAAAPAGAQSSGASLAGTVVDSNGAPLLNICVSVWDDRPLEREPVGFAVTDDGGDYRVDGLPAGDVKAFYFDCDPDPIYEYQWWSERDTFTAADAIRLTADSLHTGYDVILDLGSIVSGRTLDAVTGSGVGGVCVGLFDPELLLMNVVETDHSGEYVLPGLRANEYRIVFVDCNEEPRYAAQWWLGRLTLEVADVLALPTRTHATGADGSLRVAGRLSGRVTSHADGGGAGDVCVGVVDDEAGVVAVAVSEGDGTYVVEGVPPGTYAVVFVDCAQVPRYELRYYDDTATPENAAPVAIRSGATTSGIDAALPDLLHQGVDPADPSTWPVPDADPPAVTRWEGTTRFETAARISEETFEPGVPVAFVATGTNFPDALAGGPVAALQGGPVLLVTRDTIPEATAAELQRVEPDEIVVLGGTAVVGDDVGAELAGYTQGSVTRLAGSNRYATAAAASAAEFAAGVPVAYVATGAAFPDALSGGAAAAFRGGPILLTARDQLPTATADELERIAPAEIIVLGGAAAVSDAVVAQLSAYTSQPVERIGGSDRFDTAARIAEATFSDTDTAFVATGANFPDALAGVPAAGLAAAPLLLTGRDTIPDPTVQELSRLTPRQIIVLGGTSAISQQAEGELANFLVGTDSAESQSQPESQAASGSSPQGGSTSAAIHSSIGMTSLEWPEDISRDESSNISADPAMPLLGSTVRGESTASSEFSRHVDEVTATTDRAELAGHTGWSGQIRRPTFGGDLVCRTSSTVGVRGGVFARPPAVSGAEPRQRIWWRQRLFHHDSRYAQPWRRVAYGPWHSTTILMFRGSGTWTRHHDGRQNPGFAVGFAVSAPGWYAIVDEVHFDGHQRFSSARNQAAWGAPFCRVP